VTALSPREGAVYPPGSAFPNPTRPLIPFWPVSTLFTRGRS